MDQATPRIARLQVIRDRWLSEPLKATFPALVDDPSSHPLPATCQQLLAGTRVTSAFSVLHKDSNVAGMSYEDAVAHDRDVNFKRFGVEDPSTLLQSLSRQFDHAPGGQVDPETLKKGYILLDELRASKLELADQFRDDSPTGATADNPMKRLMRESYLADAEALGQAKGMVHELAGELGISLPLSRGRSRRG